MNIFLFRVSLFLSQNSFPLDSNRPCGIPWNDETMNWGDKDETPQAPKELVVNRKFIPVDEIKTPKEAELFMDQFNK